MSSRIQSHPTPHPMVPTEPSRSPSLLRRRPRLRDVGRLAVATIDGWVDDRVPSMGAALAFYTLFSVAPLMMMIVAMAGAVFGEESARRAIVEQVSGLVGTDSARLLDQSLATALRPGAGWSGTLIGAAVLLVGATTVFAELRSALDVIWRSPAQPPQRSLGAVVRSRIAALGLILGIGFLMIVSLVVSAAIAAATAWWQPYFGEFIVIASLANEISSFVLLTAMIAMIFKWIPQQRVAWRDVGVGAALTAALFVVGKSLIGLYIGRSGVASAYGAAASLVVLLLWVYYSAQIFLLGAEFTWVYAHAGGIDSVKE